MSLGVGFSYEEVFDLCHKVVEGERKRSSLVFLDLKVIFHIKSGDARGTKVTIARQPIVHLDKRGRYRIIFNLSQLKYSIFTL